MPRSHDQTPTRATPPDRPASPGIAAADDHGRAARGFFRTGTAPDPRFSLANERTLLAWLRTGVALIAAVLAVEVLGLDIDSSLATSATLVLTATGTALPALAWSDWLRTEKALRRRNPLPVPLLAIPVGLAVSAAGILLLVGTLAR